LADIEDSIWRKYKDAGLKVWGIGGEDDDAITLALFKHQMGLTYPILYDDGIAVQKEFYGVEWVINSPYPKDYIVGVDGRIRYVNNKYDSEEVIAVIEEELEKMKRLKQEVMR